VGLPPLTDEAIVLGADAVDWRAAVRLAGAALTAVGAARAGYADEMVRMIEEHGPYVVIAPGLALAHARPGDQVLSDGLSIVTLHTPVRFGHAHNDPVSVVLGLAITSIEGHLDSVAGIANVFNDPGAIEAIASATDRAAVIRIMEGRA